MDSANKIIISTVSEDEKHNVTISKITKQLIGLNVGNDVDDKIKDDEYSLDLTKIDGNTNQPIPQTAIYKVALPDDYNTSVYTETSETRLGPGKLDYCYIEQDKDYQVRLTHMKLPSKAGVYKYVIKEIVSPEGYAEIDEDLTLTLEFAEHEDGKLYIANATSSNNNYLRINTKTPSETNVRFSVDIINYPAEQNKFTIHYDANDNNEGTIVPEDQIKDKDTEIRLDTMEPTRTGYIFKGWTTLPSSTTVQFKPGDTFTLNQDITLYAVWEDKLYLKSKVYLIGEAPESYKIGVETAYKNGDVYISRVLPYITKYHKDRTTKEVFIKNIETNADSIQIVDVNGNEVKEKDIIGTGMTLKLTKETQNISITIVVTGDADGNGKITSADISRITNYRLGKLELTGAYLKAIDTNYDGKITAADKSKLTNVRLNLLKDF